jgi:hypothetical protein
MKNELLSAAELKELEQLHIELKERTAKRLEEDKKEEIVKSLLILLLGFLLAGILVVLF